MSTSYGSLVLVAKGFEMLYETMLDPRLLAGIPQAEKDKMLDDASALRKSIAAAIAQMEKPH